MTQQIKPPLAVQASYMQVPLWIPPVLVLTLAVHLRKQQEIQPKYLDPSHLPVIHGWDHNIHHPDIHLIGNTVITGLKLFLGNSFFIQIYGELTM